MNFIETYKIEDLSLCDEIIEFFNKSDDKGAGKINLANGPTVDANYKASTDMAITNDDEPIIKRFLIELGKCIDWYKTKYKFCDAYSPWQLKECFNIQHYAPKQGYFAWHTERDSTMLPVCNRHLVFMLYLNDVTDGGETEFFYQELKIKPEKGKIVIWPADWTHTHRGIVSNTQDKYIVTGWLSYV